MHPLPGGVQMPQLGLQQVWPEGQMLGPHLRARGVGVEMGMQMAVLFWMMQRWPEMQSTRAQSGFWIGVVGVAVARGSRRGRRGIRCIFSAGCWCWR